MHIENRSMQKAAHTHTIGRVSRAAGRDLAVLDGGELFVVHAQHVPPLVHSLGRGEVADADERAGSNAIAGALHHVHAALAPGDVQRQLKMAPEKRVLLCVW